MTVSYAKYVDATITAENNFTDAIVPMKKVNSVGYFNISVEGTFSANVVLQRSFDKGVSWYDVATYTAATETYKEDPEVGVLYRIGVKTGGFTSGSVYVRIGVAS